MKSSASRFELREVWVFGLFQQEKALGVDRVGSRGSGWKMDSESLSYLSGEK